MILLNLFHNLGIIDSFNISWYLPMIAPLHHLKSVWWCLANLILLNNLKSAKKLNYARENLKECSAIRTTVCVISECIVGWKFYHSNTTSFKCTIWIFWQFHFYVESNLFMIFFIWERVRFVLQTLNKKEKPCFEFFKDLILVLSGTSVYITTSKLSLSVIGTRLEVACI